MYQTAATYFTMLPGSYVPLFHNYEFITSNYAEYWRPCSNLGSEIYNSGTKLAIRDNLYNFGRICICISAAICEGVFSIAILEELSELFTGEPHEFDSWLLFTAGIIGGGAAIPRVMAMYNAMLVRGGSTTQQAQSSMSYENNDLDDPWTLSSQNSQSSACKQYFCTPLKYLSILGPNYAMFFGGLLNTALLYLSSIPSGTGSLIVAAAPMWGLFSLQYSQIEQKVGAYTIWKKLPTLSKVLGLYSLGAGIGQFFEGALAGVVFAESLGLLFGYQKVNVIILILTAVVLAGFNARNESTVQIRSMLLHLFSIVSKCHDTQSGLGEDVICEYEVFNQISLPGKIIAHLGAMVTALNPFTGSSFTLINFIQFIASYFSEYKLDASTRIILLVLMFILVYVPSVLGFGAINTIGLKAISTRTTQN